MSKCVWNQEHHWFVQPNPFHVSSCSYMLVWPTIKNCSFYVRCLLCLAKGAIICIIIYYSCLIRSLFWWYYPCLLCLVLSRSALVPPKALTASWVIYANSKVTVVNVSSLLPFRPLKLSNEEKHLKIRNHTFYIKHFSMTPCALH